MRRVRGEMSGFTLVEIIVAVAIFSMSIVGIVGIVATGQRNAVETRLMAKAMFLAERKMNEMYRVGYEAIDEDDESYILDETDEENPIELMVREGEFYDEDYIDYESSKRQEWLRDYYWQVIVKESEDLRGMQMVIVRVFNKNFSGENEYTDVEYGQVTQLVTYIAATEKDQEEPKDDDL